MNKIGVIAWREIRGYFSSWLAYVLLAGWLFMAGQNYWTSLGIFDTYGEYTLQGFFSNLIVVMLFIAPIITMRLVVEERSQGTLEMLFTSPITEWQVAVGKFLGAWGFIGIMLLLTTHVPFFANRYGSIDMGPVWGSYIALVVVGAAFVAYGLFCSAITASQVVAGFLSFGGLLFSWMLAIPAQVSRENDFAAFLGHLSIFTHFQGMMGGAIDTKDLIFFASVTLFFLYATVRTLESRKWS
jgi:ABC-2 type transport system permease protein